MSATIVLVGNCTDERARGDLSQRVCIANRKSEGVHAVIEDKIDVNPGILLCSSLMTVLHTS